jgi:prephenate dehydratase
LPDLGRSLNQALTSVYNTRNDPTQNQAAVENFLMAAATGFQQTAALIRKENPDAVAKSVTSTAKKRVGADPQTERVMQAIGMADSGLDTLADIVKQKGEKVTNKTGSNTIDRLLTAAGLI